MVKSIYDSLGNRYFSLIFKLKQIYTLFILDIDIRNKGLTIESKWKVRRVHRLNKMREIRRRRRG